MKYTISVEMAPRKNFQGVNVKIEKVMDLESDLEAVVETKKLALSVKEASDSTFNTLLGAN